MFRYEMNYAIALILFYISLSIITSTGWWSSS